MTDREWIEAFRRGERVHAECSLYPEVKSGACTGREHPHWRTIVCGTDSDGADRDIVECSRCGCQREVGCNFDEEYA
jgi:hypothetical protein